ANGARLGSAIRAHRTAGPSRASRPAALLHLSGPAALCLCHAAGGRPGRRTAWGDRPGSGRRNAGGGTRRRSSGTLAAGGAHSRRPPPGEAAVSVAGLLQLETGGGREIRPYNVLTWLKK